MTTYDKKVSYKFSNDCLLRLPSWNIAKFLPVKSKFDQLLCELWDKAQSDKIFRYELGPLKTKIIGDAYNFVVQLNSKRAFERRQPQEIQKMGKLFDPDLFNFTKVHPREVLFEFKGSGEPGAEPGGCETDRKVVIINASPLAYGNVLFVPKMMSCLPQVMTQDAILSSIELMLSSSHIGFRIAFNSQLASASVNHLHVHAYYVDYPLLCETLDVVPIPGHDSKYVTPKSYPLQGLVFVLNNTGDVRKVANQVFGLTDRLEELGVSHNVFITRGTDPTKPDLEPSQARADEVCGIRGGLTYDCLRIYVWPRKPNHMGKLSRTMNVAACEVSGHILVKDEHQYDSISYQEICDILGEFSYTQDYVVSLLDGRS